MKYSGRPEKKVPF